MGAGVVLFLLTASHSDTLSALSTAADAWCQAAILFIFPARTQSPPAFLLCSQFYTFCADLSTFISFFFFIFRATISWISITDSKIKTFVISSLKWWPWGQDFTYLIIFVGFWGFSLRLCCGDVVRCEDCEVVRLRPPRHSSCRNLANTTNNRQIKVSKL